MRKLGREAVEHLKEVFWALFLVYLFLVALVLLFGRQVGYVTMAWICVGFALLVSAIFAALFAINLIAAVVLRRIDRFRRKGPL